MPELGALTRSRFLARASRVLMLAAGGSAVSALVKPGKADAHHFCGHIFTTDSCPHPTGLPRVDAHGFPLRARDGKPVDDLGRAVDSAGRPVANDGRLLTDPDGRAVPTAPRTRLCLEAVSAEFQVRTWVDGSWYRCCGGRVRKLIDCCTRSRRRITGDAALRGYCYSGRTVFCVMYYDTKIPC